MKTSTFYSSLTAIMMALFFSTIFNHQAFGQNFPSEVSREGLVFDGKISSKKGAWSSDKSTIYTLNWFHPSSVYAGNTKTRDSIPVLTRGGLTDEGLLIATHSMQFYAGYSYLLALEPCPDCVGGIEAWRVKGSIGEFKQKEYLVEKAKWADKPRVKNYFPETSCQGSEEVLYLSFGNVHLVPGLDSTTGYIDIKTKTTQNDKFLQSLAANLQYSSTIFGSYAIASHNIEVSPVGSAMQQAYSSVASDVIGNKASFTISKYPSSLYAYSIETFFTPTARISFKIPTSSLSNLPSELENLLSLESIEASYICEGMTYSFRDVVILKGDIGVVMEGLEASIVYQFENVSYNSATDEYSFEIFASSSEETYLNVANIKIDFSATAFLPLQVGNMHMQVFAAQNGVLGFNNNYEIDPPQDLDASSVEVNMFAVNTDDFINLVLLDDTPRPLFGVSLKIANCETNPGLNFIPGDMQGLSQYFQPPTFPLPLVYDPVLAIDQENIPPCGCDSNPVITGYSPTTPLIAGDNQILTILGDNFGVYERSGSPGYLQTGKSSVMFTNGDQGPTDPLFIAASNDDIVSWKNTEIKVKIPSVDFGSGVAGTAASGPINVRNRCGNSGLLLEDLDIAYSLQTFRVTDDGKAKKLGLRNDNGLNGEQDGYAFAFSPESVDPDNPDINIDIKTAFSTALNTWCGVTNIRFKKQESLSPTSVAVANDGVNSITVEEIDPDDPDALAAILSTQEYFSIDCEGSSILNEDGGYILTDLDLVVDEEFAASFDQTLAEETFLHELGHAHMLAHAKCIETCTQPLMEASGGAGEIQSVDTNGANRVFETSEEIINFNVCKTGPNEVIDPSAIKQGECGVTNSTKEADFLNIKLSPNPTEGIVTISNLSLVGRFSVMNSAGQLLLFGNTPIGEFTLDLSEYQQGIYFALIVHESISSHFKIIKL